ncbi:unnamed protein product [Leuciscus chuanchicus]
MMSCYSDLMMSCYGDLMMSCYGDLMMSCYSDLMMSCYGDLMMSCNSDNKAVMAVGLLSITLCVGYIGYLHAIRESDQTLYEAVDSDGERYMRRKTSRWD